jgi:iron uptake system EfeUOB component EfeO/EfeM
MSLELKQYMFTFEGGGWNTCWAKTLRGAKKLAVQQYADSDTLNVKVDSVHLATEEVLKNAMSLFY